MIDDKVRRAPRSLKQKKDEISYSRIHFLRYFIQAHGLTNQMIASRLNLTAPAISMWFSADDVNLSLARKVVAMAGYRLDICLTREEEEIGNKGKRPAIQEFYFMGKSQKVQNLNFLYYALRRYAVSVVQLSKLSGIGQATIYYYFKTDDIAFSRLCQIARAMGCSLVISVVKDNDEHAAAASADSGKCRLISEITEISEAVMD